jgi:putative membrane protein
MEWNMKAVFLSTVALLAMSGAWSVAWAQQGSGPYYGHGAHMWDGGPWMFVGPLMMIVFLAAIVAVIVLMVRWFGGPHHVTGQHPSPGRTPFDILKERFARGEIDKAEYEERRRILGE